MRWCVASFGVLLLVVVAGTQLRHAVAAVVEYDLVAQYAFVETEHHPIYASSINGTVPGPELRVKRGDRLVVHLHNKFATEGVSIHWHGLEVRDAINMDGVVGLTQCAVPPGESMTYEFVITDEAGTYWYHTHAGIDRVASRGLIGAFIILPADDEVDPHAPLYDEDITLPFGDLFEEATYALFLQNSGSKLPSSSHAPDGTSVGTFRWWTGHVAGQPNRRFVLDVEQGKRYRLRLLNIGELYAFSVCVDNHNLTVIAADGSNTEPYEAECVQLHVAERFDVILEANQPVDNYWLRFKLTEDPAQFSNELLGVVRYTGAPADASPTTTTSPRLQQKTVNCFDAGATPEQAPDTCIPVTALNPLLSRPAMEKPTAFSHEAEFIFVPPPSFGHFTHVRDFSHGIDNPMTQTAISSKPLLQFGTEGDHVHPHINAMYFDYNQTILMYMSHHKDSTRFTHPMHLHGHKFHVVGVGYPRKNGCRWTTCEKLPMPSPESLLHPSEAPLKDTVVMPAGGWVAIAFKADNPGMWLAHCHIPLHRDDGMLWTMLEAVDRIPERNLSFAGFPSCNNTAIAHTATACDCYEDRDAVLGQTPRSDWKCSAHSLCRHVSPPLQGKADQSGQVRFGTRRNETPHWIALVIILALCFGFIFLCRWLSKRRLATPANANTAASATHGHGSGHGTGLREDAEIIAGSHATSLAEPPAVSLRWKDLRVVSAKGSKPLLRGVSGVAQPGCITGVVGASGSGKTVLLRTLAGHSVGIVWEAGEIVVGDVPVQALREENKAAVLSFLPTVAPIRGDLSVEDNINYCGALLLTNATEDEYSQALEETLEGLMLTDVRHQKAASLSQGQALRMRLAQLMIAPTRIVLLDDPLRGIDEAAGVRILKYLKRVAQEKQIAVVCAVGTATSLVSAVLDTTLELESGRVQDDLERAGNTHNTINSSSTHNNNSNSTHNKCDMNGVNGKTNDKQHAAGAETASSLPTTAKAAGVGLAQLEALHRPVASVKQQVHSLALLYMKEESPRALNKYKAVVAIGLGLVTGILWFGVGVEEDRRSFGETVSLLFAAMITWIIAFVYPAAAGVKSQYLLLRQDVSGHFYSYWLRLVVWTVFDFAVLAVWPIVFGTITFTLAYVGADWESNLTKSFILALAANVFHALGLLLGAAIPDPAAAVAVVTVVVQAMLMMAGFYRTLPDAIQWLPSVIGIPYYILTALMRTEFSANDSYRCHPSRASSAVGPHDCYIETNLLTEDYRQRNILFVQSPEAHDPSEWALVLPLVLFYIGIRILGAIILLLRIRRKFRLHAQQKLPSDHRRSSTHASSGAAPVRREPETKALISCTHSNGTATENGHCTKQRPSHHQRRASQKQLLLEDEANGDAMDGFSGPHTDVSTV